MHEFSLAQNIIEIVDESLKKNGVRKATEIELEIGTLSGVEIPALEMAFESLKADSSVEQATIKLNIIKAKAVCRTCGKEFYPEDLFSPCPKCSAYGPEIVSGKELLVKSIVAE
ncbi:MAG: hydrogenase maturation nickel metallochaperone HypA [Bacteroidales bacterium]|jgi:hydrogenase nickel incorporation protein HypA/HybF